MIYKAVQSTESWTYSRTTRQESYGSEEQGPSNKRQASQDTCPYLTSGTLACRPRTPYVIHVRCSSSRAS